MPNFWLRTFASWLSLMRVMSMPSINTWPLVGLSSPAMMPSSVDLPEPEGPTIATNSPLFTSMLMPLRISMRVPPRGRDLRISLASNAGETVVAEPRGCNVVCSSENDIWHYFPFLNICYYVLRQSSFFYLSNSEANPCEKSTCFYGSKLQRL